MVEILGFIVLWVLCGALSAAAGEGDGLYLRRWIIPAVRSVLAIVLLHSFWAVLLMLGAVVLGLGYGVNTPPDKSSAIGTFWLKKFNNDERKTNLATRGTIGFLDGLVAVVIPFIVGGAGAVALWLWALAIMTVMYPAAFFLLCNKKQLALFGQKFNWDEIVIGGTATCIIVELALLCR